MPLPSSGPLSLNDIQTEFGGTNPIGLNEYYAGGGLVPAGTTGTNGAVPSSGAISIFNFYGTAAVIPQWSSGYASFVVDLFKGKPRVVGNSLIYGFIQNSNQNLFNVANLNAATGAINWVNRFTIPSGSNYDTNANGSFYVDGSGNSYILWGRQTTGVSAVLAKVDSSGNLVWSKSLGLPLYTESSNGTNIITDSASNIYIAASNLQNTSNGSVLYKYDSSGNFVWARYWTDSAVAVNGFRVGSLAIDSSDNITMWGATYSPNVWGFLVQYSSAGTFLSATRVFNGTFGTYYAYSQYGSIAIAPSTGNVYIAGYSTPSGSGAVQRLCVTKLNSSMTHQWTRFFTPTVNQITRALVLDSSENVYITFGGATSSYLESFAVLNTSGTLLWSTQFGNSPAFAANQSFINSFQTAVVSGDSIYALASLRYQDAAPQDVMQVLRFSITSFLPDGIYPSRSALSSTRGVASGVDQDPGASTTTSIAPATTSNASSATISGSSANTTVNQTSLTLPTVYNGTISPVTTTGSFAFVDPGTYTWLVPTGVTRVSAVVVGAGSAGLASSGGGGGGLAYANNYTVTPGTNINVQVGTGPAGSISNCAVTRGTASWFVNACTLKGGSGACAGNPSTGGSSSGSARAGGGSGGNGSGSYGSGGGAGGYSGNGGAGVSCGTLGNAGTGGAGGSGAGASFAGNTCYIYMGPSGSGGGVGIISGGSSGAGGAALGSGGYAGSGGYTQTFGGGGGAGGYYIGNVGTCCEYRECYAGAPGHQGAVRIIWPGSTRSFPSTNTGAP